MMMESDMKPLISKKTGLFIDVDNDEEDGDAVPSKSGEDGLSTLATILFVLFFVFSGIYMAWFTWYACYQLCETSPTKPNNLLDEKCYFIVNANKGKPDERLMKKYHVNEVSFRLMYLTLTKLRKDYYQPEPKMILTIIHLIAAATFVLRFYFLFKKPHYVLDYFCIFDSYLFGLAFYFIFKLLQLFTYYFFYYEEDCFKMFL